MSDYDRLLEFSFEKIALTAEELAAEGKNVEPNPTEAQAAAGNYRHGHVLWKGLGITIETAKGQVRSGTSKDGKPWSIEMLDFYGYIKKTESEADGDHIDIFLCDENLDSELVFVVSQYVDGAFDEAKCVAGCVSEAQARKVYLRNYAPGWNGLHSICPMTLEQFRWWIKWGDTSKEIKDGYFAGPGNRKAASDEVGIPVMLGKEAAWTFVPTQALDAIRKEGLLSAEQLAKRPELLQLIAKSRHAAEATFAQKFQRDTEEKLKGWKPEASQGPNIVWRRPPEDLELPEYHPMRKFDLTPVRVRLAAMLRDMPETRVHGMELTPYTEDAVPEERHHDLSPAEIVKRRKTSAKRLWAKYSDPEGVGMYAPDVPHASVISPTGGIPAKYLMFPDDFKKAASDRRDERDQGAYTVAVDLDGTLAEQTHPFDPDVIGELRPRMKYWVKRWKDAGARIIIHTVRGKDSVTEAYLKKHEIPYDHLNSNPDQPEGSSTKLIADAYVDDRAFNAQDPDEIGPAVLAEITGEEPEEKAGPGMLIIRRTVVSFSPGSIMDDFDTGETLPYDAGARMQESVGE